MVNEWLKSSGCSGALHLFDFWSGGYYELRLPLSVSAALVLPSILSHSAHLYAIRQVVVDEPSYLGSDLHFSCGKEVALWRQVDEGTLTLKLDLGKREAAGNIWLFLPSVKNSVECSGPMFNGEATQLLPNWPSVWKIAVTVNGINDMHVSF
mmetsp:Transcript_10081/g.13739  ORF Transcript_10081/g.13739 Transcript_10081/m.13739 type:complete len:152 (-) Transcript_10081:169-624(-)